MELLGASRYNYGLVLDDIAKNDKIGIFSSSLNAGWSYDIAVKGSLGFIASSIG